MRALGYRRCSTAEQATSHLGLDAQTAAIEEAARRLGADLVAVHEDAGRSGGLPVEKRPGLLAAVSDLGRGDVLIVARSDRLGRDVVLCSLIERLVTKRGARLVSAAGEGSELDGPSGPLVRTILDAVNAYEKAVIALRTRLALRAKRSRGQRAGAVPYGHALASDGRTLVSVPEEQAVPARILTRRREGASLREIAAELNERRVSARRGGAWRHSAVLSVLRTAATHA